MKSRRFFRLVVGFNLLLLLSLSLTAAAELWPPQDLHQAYQEAVQDAVVATPEKINRNLVAIVPWNKDLSWETDPGQGRVLVATFTSWKGYLDYVGQEMVLTRESWVTVVPEVQKFCQRENNRPADELAVRIEQLLGLPPYAGHAYMVEFYADPKDIFRPSPDPEITDHEAGLDYPAYLGTQVVSAEHTRWYADNLAGSSGTNGYPWTRLGYTYDWGNPLTKVGLSEFVVKVGATVKVKAVATVDKYCY